MHDTKTCRGWLYSIASVSYIQMILSTPLVSKEWKLSRFKTNWCFAVSPSVVHHDTLLFRRENNGSIKCTKVFYADRRKKRSQNGNQLNHAGAPRSRLSAGANGMWQERRQRLAHIHRLGSCVEQPHCNPASASFRGPVYVAWSRVKGVRLTCNLRS